MTTVIRHRPTRVAHFNERCDNVDSVMRQTIQSAHRTLMARQGPAPGAEIGLRVLALGGYGLPPRRHWRGDAPQHKIGT
jgi:hypothetical protein